MTSTNSTKDFDIDLYPNQLAVIPKLKNGSILCADVGAGKSRTALGYYFITQGGSLSPYRPMNNPRDLYIITTAKKRDDCEWLLDMCPFLLSTDPEVSYYKNKVVIDSWNNIKKYSNVYGAFFIFDEQRLTGSGPWVKAFYKIANKNKWILLSATPGDKWEDYIPVFVANGFYKNKTEFLRQHAVYSYYSKYPKIINYMRQGLLQKYRSQILVQMENNSKHTVRHNENVIVNYDKILYQKVNKDRWNIYEGKPIENISELCYTLRKVTNSDHSREEEILKISKEHKRVIIFYNFNYELDILKSIPYEYGTIVAEWNGHEHQRVPTSDRWVYLVQYDSGCEGWNCITTDTIIFYSQNYSYRKTFQASGRIDRLNTPYTDLYYYTLRSNSPIDVAIASALKKKKNFNESAFCS